MNLIIKMCILKAISSFLFTNVKFFSLFSNVRTEYTSSKKVQRLENNEDCKTIEILGRMD